MTTEASEDEEDEFLIQKETIKDINLNGNTDNSENANNIWESLSRATDEEIRNEGFRASLTGCNDDIATGSILTETTKDVLNDEFENKNEDTLTFDEESNGTMKDVTDVSFNNESVTKEDVNNGFGTNVSFNDESVTNKALTDEFFNNEFVTNSALNSESVTGEAISHESVTSETITNDTDTQGASGGQVDLPKPFQENTSDALTKVEKVISKTLIFSFS